METNIYEKKFIHKSTNETTTDKKILIFPFDIYEIGVIIDSQNRFIGVQNIKIKKDVLAADPLNYSNNFNAEKILDDFLKTLED